MPTKTYEPEFIALTDDLLFKETFGKNPSFLEYLLEVYFNYPLEYLKDKLEISYESPLDKSRFHDKNFRNDLKVIINNEIICNLEMYSVFNKNSLQKSKSYIMRIYSTQLNIGDDYSKIKKVTQINFVNKIDKEVKILIDEKLTQTLYLGNELVSNDLRLDIVRLDLVRNIDYNFDKRFMNLLQFLNANTKEKRDLVAKGDEKLMEINNWINNYMTDDEWWRTYNDDFWNKRIYHEDGLKKGKIEEKFDIAKKMLAKGLSINEIVEYTDLSTKEIINLQNEK